MIELSDEILEKLTVNLFTVIFKSTFKSIKTTKTWISEKVRENDYFNLNSSKYINKLEERYDIMRVLGMSEPVSIRTIYVKINILEKISSEQRKSINELSKKSELIRKSFGKIIKTIDGIDVVNKYQKLIILGKPGCGKSTFLKNILFQAIDGNLKNKRIPVFISLKSYSETNCSIIEYIVEEFDICGFPEPKPFIEKILEKGNFIILLDGLDEVSKEKSQKVISEIKKLSDKYSNNQIIISCRIAAYNYLFEKFKDVEIADFQDSQINNFVCNWFSTDKVASNLCLKNLNENPPIKELGSNPLLLTLLCIAFEQTLDFPRNRSELYKEAIDALLKKWDSSRGIKRDEIYKYLSPKRKESMFARIAAYSFEKNQYFFKQNELEKYIAEYIKNLPQSNNDYLIPDSEVVIKSIESQHGIFVERSKRIYSFSHLTIQEYFTAKYIIDHFSKGTLNRLIKSHLIDKNWREVFLLTTEMLDEADDFLIFIKKRIHSLILNDSYFVNYLNKLDSLLKKDFSYLSIFNKILFVVMITEITKEQEYNNIERLLNKDERVDDLIKETFEEQNGFTDEIIMENLINDAHSHTFFNSRRRIKEFIRASNQVKGNRIPINYTKQMDEIWHELSKALRQAFGMGINKFEFITTDKDISSTRSSYRKSNKYSDDENIDNFFNASTLLLDCLNTDCYVTKETRNNLLENLFQIAN